MNQKVKVTKEIAQLISLELIACEGPENFLKIHSDVKFPWEGYQKPLNEITVWEMANILINGYEVEETPEEILQNKYYGFSDYYELDRACKDSFRFVLNTLNIKIKGIND